MDPEAACGWAYREQRVHTLGAAGLFAIEAEADGMAIFNRSADGCVAVERIARLGCRVEGGGGLGAAHPDALAIDEAVRRLPRLARALVIRQAVEGSPPAWDVGPLRARPRRIGTQIVELWADGACCPITWEGTDEARSAARYQYRLWWLALRDVGERLARVELAAIALAPLAADPFPWRRARTEVVKPGRPEADANLKARAAALLAAGQSIRAVAAAVGLGRDVVHRIALAT